MMLLQARVARLTIAVQADHQITSTHKSNVITSVEQVHKYSVILSSLSFVACRRGSPMFQRDPDGKVTQFVQRQQMCNPESGCGDAQYECQVLQPGRALCCPNSGT